ncbi:MAG TPA: T9SS type A sorting domain-containing protein [Chitinophagales bacterium]|nr:T9SS type A sorting domain-containing protein [Chitinophagales bacterium]
MRLLLFTVALFVQSVAWACGGLGQQVYAAEIRYKLDPANNMRCLVNITMDFDINEGTTYDSIIVTWGDGIVSALYADSITDDSLADVYLGRNHIYTHYYSGAHLYDSIPSVGHYTVFVQNQYRVNYINNIAGGAAANMPMYLATQIVLNSSPQFTYQPPLLQPLGLYFGGFDSLTEHVLMNNTTGDSVAFEQIVPLVEAGVTVPQYLAPGSFCQQLAGTNSTFNLDTKTGEINWNTPCYTGVFAIAYTVNSYRNGVLTGSLMRDQNIYIGWEPLSTAITTTANKQTGIRLFPNPANTELNVSITDAAAGFIELSNITGQKITMVQSNGNTVQTLDVSALAPGIYFVTYRNNSGKQSVEKFVKN